MMDFAFTEMKDSRGDLEAIWEWIGEGWSGDYDETDPDDMPLLRFSVYRDGEQVDDASYCTRMPINAPDWMLWRGLQLILDACDDPSPKRRLEELSWLSPADFERS